MKAQQRGTSRAPIESGGGWGGFLISVFSRAYLVFLLTLAAIALVPSLFGWHGSVVQSGSMEPHISAGDVVLLSDLGSDMPVPMGGVVEFRGQSGPGADSERLMLHRIVAANPDGTFVTAGDANADVDSTPLAREQITGQARLLVPFVGLPSYWLGTANLPALAIWSVLTLAALVAAAWSFPDRYRTAATPSPENPGADPEDDDPFRQSEDADNASVSGGVSRRSVLSAVPLLALPAAATAAFGARPVEAFFTGRTANAGNSWQAAASFGSRVYFNYRAAIALEAPWAYYPLDEASTIYTAQDASGNNRDAAYSYFGVTNSVQGALVNETNRAITVNGTADATFATPGPVPGPQVFSLELWFRTGSGQGGELLSFGNAQSGTSNRYDRNVYMGSDGKLNFGVYTSTTRVVTSARSYNDSAWHHVVATLSGAGMGLYVDGQLVASGNATSAENFEGYWRIAGDNLNGWPNQPVNTYFAGSIDEISIYTTALSGSRVSTHYQAALASTTGNYASAVLTDAPAYYYHLEEGGPGIMADLSGNGRHTTYPATGVTYNVAGPLVKMNNRAAQFNGSNGSLVTQVRQSNPQTFSTEAWFRTTTTRGGQIIGFGSTTNFNSGQHDRHLYLLNNGRLVFGIYPSTVRVIASPASYNDGAWHHVVATLSGAGMCLYVDGALVASDTRYRSAEAYNGYWHIGAGNLTGWPSQPTSNYFNGALDEVAIYARALTPAQVSAHYAAAR